jgi:hypothetical protein
MRLELMTSLNDPKPFSKQITGNVGLYFACYRLSQYGWNALPTSRNARGIDIVAYKLGSPGPEGGKGDCDVCKLFQVKTVTKGNAVSLGLSVENIGGDFWIIVVLDPPKDPICFVMLREEIRERVTQDKGGKQACWLSHKDFFDDRFREQWGRIN